MVIKLPETKDKTQEKIANQIYKHAFQQYLSMKVSFRDIYHKKIVQIMYIRYKGYCINLNLSSLKQKENYEGMKYVYQCLKIVPVFNSLNLNFKLFEWDLMNSELFRDIFQFMNITRKEKLQSMILDLQYCLQYKQQCLKLIIQGIIELKQLKSLRINFGENGLGESTTNMILLKNGLQQLENLNSLSLDFTTNYIGMTTENIRELGLSFQKMKKLSHLNLVLQSNILGINEDNFKCLGGALYGLKGSLKQLKLNLDQDYFGGLQEQDETRSKNICQLGEDLQKLSGLETLEISLRYNDLESHNMDGLVEGIKNLDKLKYLKIVLQGDNKEETEKIIQQLSQLQIQELNIK